MTYPCTRCSETFPTLQAVGLHMRNKHLLVNHTAPAQALETDFTRIFGADKPRPKPE